MTTPDTEPTTKEREQWQRWVDGKTPNTTPSARHMVGSLLAQVEQLEAENERLRAKVAEYQDQAAQRQESRLQRLQ